MAAHVGTTGHLGPKKAILNSFPIALNLFERNSHGLCLGLRFPDLWKAKAAASLEPTPGQLLALPGPLLAGQVPRGSPGSEPGSLHGHGASGGTRWGEQELQAGTAQPQPDSGPSPRLGLDGEGAPQADKDLQRTPCPQIPGSEETW